MANANPTQFKEFTPDDIQKFVLAQRNDKIQIANATDASDYDVDAFCIGALSGTVNRPDFYGASTSNISRSGAMNHIAKYFYNRYTDTWLDSTNGIYTVPRSDSAILFSCKSDSSFESYERSRYLSRYFQVHSMV